MDGRRHEPWTPDRSWADPFIVTLALLIVLVVSTTFQARHGRPAPPPAKAELEGRLKDLVLAAPKLLGAQGSAFAGKDALPGFAARKAQGWDQAILAVHAGEYGDRVLGARLAQDAPGPTGDRFRQAWTWAYEGKGQAPPDLQDVRQALGDGYAAAILEARCLARSGGDPAPLERRARDWALPRLTTLAGVSLAGLFLGLGGLAFLVFLCLAKGRPQPLARYGMSGRAALIVLLGWFLTHLMAGYVISVLVAVLPFLRPVSMPLVYAFHAVLGLGYLCLAEGIGFRTLWARVAPGPAGRALVPGLGFFALAFALVVVVAVLLSPFLNGSEAPQRELMDMLSRLKGPLTVTLLFLTVAVLAPFFEELLFRGFMLPWLGERLEAKLGRRGGWAAAVGITGLTFAAMHLQPLGLPTLGTLGVVLGLAFLRTGNLYTAILVHALWNGGIFIVLRLVG